MRPVSSKPRARCAAIDPPFASSASEASSPHPWRFAQRPRGEYCEPYWLRLEEMRPDLDFDGDWQELAVRFTAFAAGVHCAILGTSRIGHLQANLDYARAGPLPAAMVERITHAFAARGDGWRGEL